MKFITIFVICLTILLGSIILSLGLINLYEVIGQILSYPLALIICVFLAIFIISFVIFLIQ